MKCPICGEENEYDPRLSNLGNLCWSCDTPINLFGWLTGLKSLETLLKKDFGDARVSCGNRWLYYLDGMWIVREQKPYQKKPAVLYAGQDFILAVEKLDEEYPEGEMK